MSPAQPASRYGKQLGGNCRGLPKPSFSIIRKASVSSNYASSSYSMDLNDSGSGWDNLGHDPQLSILSVLKQRKDKDSMQAMMQTSRDLRLLASSLISTIEIRDASALDHYPRHAAITTMLLRMRPSRAWKAHMEPSDMVSWLQATSAAGIRLAAVTSVEVELPGMPQEAMDPATMDSLLEFIAGSCPNLRCLSMANIVREEEDLIRAMFTAIGRHLPGITELQLAVSEWDDHFGCDFAIAGIDWATCLPRGLQKFTGGVKLHHELLQQLVLMPSLMEVDVLSLSTGEEEKLAVHSDACAWRILRTHFRSCQDLGRFTSAMPLLHLYCDDPPVWGLAADVGEHAVVAKAAAWLSQIGSCPEELSLWVDSDRTASSAGFISALAPLSGRLVSLGLGNWPVIERTLDELADALPNIRKLNLWCCSISDSAWSRMLSMTSVTDLTIKGRADSGGTIPLAQIIAFASAASRPLTLTLKGGALSSEDQAGWEAFEAEQRRNGGLRHMTVHITREW